MKIRYLLTALAVLPAFGFIDTPAFAQATRTWVSGLGDDANPCSRTAPCKTFAGAISRTAAAGEINVIDPGGFGALTINKAITIRAVGVEAGVLAAGTNGITINAGPNDNVALFGIDFEGTNVGLDGVNIVSAGNVVIEHCNIHQFSGNGVTIATTSAIRVIIRNSTISANAGSGVVVNSTPGFGHVRIFESMILTNINDGIQVNGAGNDAIISNDEVLANHRQLNVSTGVSGGAVYSLGNNVIPSSYGDNPSPYAMK